MGERSRRRFEVTGLVQGVGFRPFVYVTASELGLTGQVANTPSGVVVEVEGDARRGRPPSATGSRTTPHPWPRSPRCGRPRSRPRGGTGFTIEPSEGGDGRTLASPDVAICDDCLAELADPADRRYRHPFITCTNCGPRFTIITALPYDRARTTMAGFAMCAACRREYDDPTDRRFHAQPIACHDCGPTLELVGDGRPLRRRGRAGRRPASCSRRAGSSRSRASAATTWPATPATRAPSPSCAVASSAATSRSR